MGWNIRAITRNARPRPPVQPRASGRHEILNEAEKGLAHRDVGHWLYQFLDEPTTEI